MKSIALKFAVSGLTLGVATAALVVSGLGTPTAAATERNDAQAARLFEQAGQAIASGDLNRAITLLEQAVALAPRDAGYRMLLADAYMKTGRFRSAEAAYGDVLTIDPSRARAGLSHALMRAANGRQQDALAELEHIEGQTQPADIGLAYALAGSPQRAVDILEPAARAMGATPRIRQNLALAYALGGDWQRARTVAAQDVPAGELAERMSQWATLAQRTNAGEQIAALMGVIPVADPGQPAQLALAAPAPDTAPVAIAGAEPPVVASTAAADSDIPMPTDAAAPVAAAAEPIPSGALPVTVAEAAPAPVVAPAPVAEAPSTQYAAAAADQAQPEQAEWGIDDHGAVELPAQDDAASPVPVRVRYAAAADDLSRPDPVIMPVRPRAARTLSLASRLMSAAPSVARHGGAGRYVVQLGAFSSAANAERAWQMAQRRFALRDAQPVTMTIDLAGRMLHRVAVSGFDKRRDATQLCNAILSRGGQCFVRASQGDIAVNWAARYASR
jgi:Flp pilus assembly protein TadD